MVNVETNGDIRDNDTDVLGDDDDDGENVISLSKIKASVDNEDDRASRSDAASEKSQHDVNVLPPEIHLQPPFQPGSSPLHLLSRFMVNFFLIQCQ